MKAEYSFSILRYVHDPLTQEFVNIGVALYSPQPKYLKASCTTQYGRVTRMFRGIDGVRFRQLTCYIESEINRLGERLSSELPFSSVEHISKILAQVLPPDDSSIQFSSCGKGLSANLDKTLSGLYDRYVEQYNAGADSKRRDDDEVWRVFREPLERRHLTPHLAPKRIATSDYAYEFKHSWKNEQWHLYEPVSFDLMASGSILDKANRWLGRVTNLAESTDRFKLHVLMGEPQESHLKESFVKAQNIMRKMPGEKEFIQEDEAEDFAVELEREFNTHSG